jgi:hypothetical protein
MLYESKKPLFGAEQWLLKQNSTCYENILETILVLSTISKESMRL